MSYKVSMLSLGCSKNRVDGELMLAFLRDAGYEIVEDINICDIAIVNTCGFIDDAKKESIEEILDLARLKNEGIISSIIVTGCLAERYQNEVMKEMPEIDAVVGIGANSDIVKIVNAAVKGKKTETFPDKLNLPMNGRRVRTTPKHYAYLKVAEGCDNRCTYCAIPLIRGKFRSRRMEDIIDEAKLLSENGVRELLVIAQDTTRYGEDIYGELMLPQLLKELCKIEKISWIRILYCYPDRITDELIEVMKSEEKVLNYIDLPLQHCNGKILKNMNRKGDKESLRLLIEKMRKEIPGVVIRTTFICGFPGETEKEFEELSEFVNEIRFERMGCFTYSKEEDTKAALMEEQVDEEIKKKRQQILMEQQMGIMEDLCKSLINKTIKVIVDAYDEEEKLYIGRSVFDSPDIDGGVLFYAQETIPKPGEFVDVKINDFVDCDLIGEIVE